MFWGDLLFKSNLTPQECQIVADKTIEGYRKFLNPGFVKFKRAVESKEIEWSGDGAIMRDTCGREFIDCLGGYGVFALGHRPRRVIEETIKIMDRICLYSQELLNPMQAALAEMLADIAPGDLCYTYYHGGGAESNDAAIKMARLATGRTKHVSFTKSFHGKTFGALSATNRPILKSRFEPLVPGWIEPIVYGDLESAEQTFKKHGHELASCIVEAIQGEGGIIVPPPEFLPGLRKLCDQYDVILHIDEVQSGMCRSGKFFASEHFGVKPDMMTLGKALGGGVQTISAFMGTPKVWKNAEENPWWFTNTFAGSQLSCAAALVTIKIMQEDNLAEVSLKQGEYFKGKLTELKNKFPEKIKDVRGLGLFIGVEMQKDEWGLKTANKLFELDVLTANTINNPAVIRIEPPLVISNEQIDTVIERFDRVLIELS